MINQNTKYKNIFLYLISLFPIFLITGPVIPEVFCFIFTIFFFIYFKKIKFLFNRGTYIFIFLFLLSINISSFFSPEIDISLKRSISFFRYICFSFAFAFFLIKYENLKKYLLNILIILFFIFFLDSLFQFVFKFNLLGFDLSATGRVSSLFGDELIMGGYIVKILALYLFFQNIVDKKNTDKQTYLIIIISFILILLSGERTSFVQFFGLLIIYSFLKFNLKKILISISTAAVLLIFLFQFNIKSIDRIFNHTLFQLKQTKSILYPSHRHYMHYHTAFHIFLDNPVFGNGIKSFRFLCDKKKYQYKIIENLMSENKVISKPYNGYLQFKLNLEDNKYRWYLYFYNDFDELVEIKKIFYLPYLVSTKDLIAVDLEDFNFQSKTLFLKNDPIYLDFDISGACNTHPHNIYLQLLSETGIAGFIFFLIILLNLLKTVVLLSFKKIRYKLSQIENSQFIINCTIIIIFFPIIPHGSLFNNWNSIFFAFLFACQIYLKSVKKLKKL